MHQLGEADSNSIDAMSNKAVAVIGKSCCAISIIGAICLMVAISRALDNSSALLGMPHNAAQGAPVFHLIFTKVLAFRGYGIVCDA